MTMMMSSECVLVQKGHFAANKGLQDWWAPAPTTSRIEGEEEVKESGSSLNWLCLVVDGALQYQIAAHNSSSVWQKSEFKLP